MAIIGNDPKELFTVLERMARETPAQLASLPRTPLIEEMLRRVAQTSPVARAAVAQARGVDPATLGNPADTRNKNNVNPYTGPRDGEDHLAAHERSTNIFAHILTESALSIGAFTTRARTFISNVWNSAARGFNSLMDGSLLQRGEHFFAQTVPHFFTQTVPNFFTRTVPQFVTQTVPHFFTQTVPRMARRAWHRYGEPVVNAIANSPPGRAINQYVITPAVNLYNTGRAYLVRQFPWLQPAAHPAPVVAQHSVTVTPQPVARQPQPVRSNAASLRLAHAQAPRPALAAAPRPAVATRAAPAVRPNRGLLNVELSRAPHPTPRPVTHPPVHAPAQVAAAQPARRRYQAMAPA